MANPEKKDAGIPVEWLNEDSNSKRYHPEAQSVKLLTMHSSKGLEFPVVFIPGVGFMPNQSQAIADEARQLYVAMTRATEFLER
ncbi:3'-5' exonuclease [Phormidium tenue]|jgi:superfamily I DNA/RNA helicase|uniref:3'-5' exonuclease n=1 Tax=Phormidium tenue TaxID=126344 RepID=UPI001F54BB93|nr:3'-5' exonuclease [Phormidium tenue]